MNKRKILIVDDRTEVRHALCNILNPHYDISTASNGAEAINALAKEIYNLMIIDIVMPQKEGIETIAEAKKEHPDLKIIAMSGVDAKDLYLSSAETFGVDEILGKPFEAGEVIKKVQKLLGG